MTDTLKRLHEEYVQKAEAARINYESLAGAMGDDGQDGENQHPLVLEEKAKAEAYLAAAKVFARYLTA